jgi:DNA oxidative demethylase
MSTLCLSLETPGRIDAIGPGAAILRGFVAADAALICAVEEVAAAAPFRHMTTPGGRSMSVAMTNCGAFGWVSDTRGYRYTPNDPDSGQPWPAMPSTFCELASAAAAAVGYARFEPDACLINRYAPGNRLAPHQDRDEARLGEPIVSVSLGLPATFLFGGARRADRPARYRLGHGDVVVWGGESRLYYHGVAPLQAGAHAVLGRIRINLTLRRAR